MNEHIINIDFCIGNKVRSALPSPRKVKKVPQLPIIRIRDSHIRSKCIAIKPESLNTSLKDIIFKTPITLIVNKPDKSIESKANTFFKKLHEASNSVNTSHTSYRQTNHKYGNTSFREMLYKSQKLNQAKKRILSDLNSTSKLNKQYKGPSLEQPVTGVAKIKKPIEMHNNVIKASLKKHTSESICLKYISTKRYSKQAIVRNSGRVQLFNQTSHDLIPIGLKPKNSQQYQSIEDIPISAWES